MASLKPVIHGRDHLPGGSDPIPAAAAPRIWWFGDQYKATQTIPDSAETQLIFDGRTGSNIGDGAPVEFGVDPQNETRFTSLAGGQTYFARLSIQWFSVFAAYRYVRFGYDAPAGSVSNMLDLNIALANQTDAEETSKRQFQRIERIVPAFVFIPGRYLRLRCFAYQESGGDEDIAGATLEIYGIPT